MIYYHPSFPRPTSLSKPVIPFEERNPTQNLADISFRMRYVADNPQIAIRFFDLKMQKLISEFLKAKLNSSFHYFRCEFQQRGSVHIHGLAN